MKKQQSGFTLIELVIVIVILGLLAATALPRFADLTGDAEEAAMDGIAGGVRSASAIVHAQALVDGAVNTSVSLEGVNITLANGYPTADSAGIVLAVDTGNLAGIASGGAVTWTVSTNCVVTYNPAPANGSPTIATTPSATCNP